MMDFPEAAFTSTNGVTLAVHGAGPAPQKARATVVLLHGFPELAFSWRYQIPALAEAGYRVLAPDLRGYGRSDKPAGRAAYHMRELTADIAGLLDADGVGEAVMVGHDWGAFIAWSLPWYAPERTAGVAGMNVPYRPRAERPPIELFKAIYGPQMYIVRFQQEGVAEPVFERDMARTLRFFMRRPRQAGDGGGGGAFSVSDLDLISAVDQPEGSWPGEPFLSDAELQVYIDAFAQGGMTAPIHYYRNIDPNWEDMARFQPPGDKPERIKAPALMVTAGRDGVLPAHLADGIDVYFDDYERVDIENSGHWTQQEQPEAVNAALLDWLGRKIG